MLTRQIRFRKEYGLYVVNQYKPAETRTHVYSQARSAGSDVAANSP
jgi:hypothetical protein